MIRSAALLIVFCFFATSTLAQTSGTGGGLNQNDNRPRRNDNPPRRQDDDLVKRIQEQLYQLNYDFGRINGVLNSKTRTAIRKVQRKINFEVDGRPSRRLLRRLQRSKKSKIWGAIAMTTGGAYGTGWNFKTRRAAERRALNGCINNASRKACGTPLTATGSSCIALATYKIDGRKGYIARARRTLDEAENSALNRCEVKTGSPSACKIRTSFCANGSHKRQKRTNGG